MHSDRRNRRVSGPDTFGLCERGVHMPKAQGPYPPQFRQQIVERVRAGEAPTTLARENSCSASAIRNWVNQADQGEGRRSDRPTNAERKELRQLRREVRELREELEIVANAATWFARKAGYGNTALASARRERER